MKVMLIGMMVLIVVMNSEIVLVMKGNNISLIMGYV